MVSPDITIYPESVLFDCLVHYFLGHKIITVLSDPHDGTRDSHLLLSSRATGLASWTGSLG